MDTKEQLIKAIQGWVRLDNEIRKLKMEELTRKDEQKKLSADLMNIMSKNEIDEVDINNGKLIYSKKNVKKRAPKKAKTVEKKEVSFTEDILTLNVDAPVAPHHSGDKGKGQIEFDTLE